ncbi:hypothetical protein JP0109_07120 [Helicobacter pylori]|nr:hypothetical protein JP0109_07120 [Helicobacter pylori]
MNALKKLSFCALLSLGLFAQTAHAESLKDTINYPDWLKINLFDEKNPAQSICRIGFNFW